MKDIGDQETEGNGQTHNLVNNLDRITGEHFGKSTVIMSLQV